MITMSTPSCSGSTLREASSTSAVICGYWRMKSPSRLARNIWPNSIGEVIRSNPDGACCNCMTACSASAKSCMICRQRS